MSGENQKDSMFHTKQTQSSTIWHMYLSGAFQVPSSLPLVIKPIKALTARAAAIYRDMRYIAIFFWSYRDTNVHGYTEIDGRIDGERRKYTNSHSAVHSNSAAVLRTYIIRPH